MQEPCGVGKSSTALALGNYLGGAAGSKAGRRVLIIDLDPQGNLSHTLRIGKDAVTVWDVFSGSKTIAEAIQKASSVDCPCSSPSLSGADHSLDQTGKEYILKEALEPVMDKYDYIVIDTAPALSILTINALAVCTEVVIPAQADIYSLQEIGQLYQTIEAVRKYCNPALTIAGILITRFKAQLILNREIVRFIEQTAESLHKRSLPRRFGKTWP